MSQLFVDDVVSKEGTNSVGFSKGISVSVASTFSGDVSIGGTLTYEDVTNIDVLGIATYRNSLYVGSSEGSGTGTGISFTTQGNAYFGKTGVVTATTFVGNLTGNPTGSAAWLTAIPGGQITGALAAVDGSALTGMANTANVSTSDLFVVGVSTLTGQANIGSGVTINSTGIEVTSGIITAGTCFKAGGGTWGPGIGATILGSGNAVFAGIVTATTLKYGTTSVETAIDAKASTGKAIAMAMVFGF